MEEKRPTEASGSSLADREPVQVPRSQVTPKTVVTVSAVVAGVALGAWLVSHSLLSIGLTVAAALLATALNHGVELLHRKGLGRRTAIAVVIAGLFAAIAGIFVVLIPAALSQVRQLADHGPELVERLRHTRTFGWLNQTFDLERRFAEATQDGSGLAERAVDPAVKVLTSILGAAAAAVTVAFLVIFMLLFGGRLVRGLLAESLPVHRQLYERVLAKIYRSVGGYLAGLGLIAALNTTLTTGFLAIAGVPFFVPLGLLSGIGSLIPLVGATAAGVVLTLVAFAAKGAWFAVLVGSYVLLYQQFENHVVAPLMYRRTVELNPLITLLGIIFFAELAGLAGAFLAVPSVAVMQIVLRELFLLRRERLGLPLEGPVATGARRPFWRRHQRA